MPNDANTRIQAFINECQTHIRRTQKKHKVTPANAGEKTPAPEGILDLKTLLPRIIENPLLVATPQKRIAEAILSAGVQPIPKRLHYFYENPETMFEYKPFEHLYGIHDVLHELVLFFVAGGHGNESSRTILWLISEPGHGKTEWLLIIKRLLEQCVVPILKDCPNNDSPLWALPTEKKTALTERFGVDFSNHDMPDICASCKERLVKEYHYDYLRFPVEFKLFKERFGGIGIYTSDPKDISQDSVEEFTGSIELGESSLNPRATEPGAFQIAQHGILVLEEGLRREPEMLHPLISASQSGHVQAPGRIGRASVNTLVVITSNEEVYEDFIKDQTNSLYASRGITFRFRRNLILSEEIKTFEKMLARSHVARNAHLHLPAASMDLIGRVFIASAIGAIRERNEWHHFNRVIDLYNGVDPETLGMKEPAWQLRKNNNNHKKDGYTPSLSVREVKGVIDVVLAQLDVEQRYSRKEGHDDPIHLCLAPFRVYAQLLKYLKELDRIDQELTRALIEFATYVFQEKTIPLLKAQFVTPEALEAECIRLFAAIKNGDLKQEVQTITGVENENYEEFLKSIEHYDDVKDIGTFIRLRALKTASIDEHLAAQRAREKDWCSVCVRDVWEGLRAYRR